MNTDPREKPQELGPRRGCSWFVGVLLLLLVLGVLWMSSQWSQFALNLNFPLVNVSSSKNLQTISLPQHTFQITDQPQVIVKDFAGLVIFQANAGRNVSVNAVSHQDTTGGAGDIQYSVIQQSNTIKVNVTRSGSSQNNESVDITVALPALSNIQVVLGAGNINASGVSGVVNLQTNAGSIALTGGTIDGTSICQSEAGSITFSGTLAPKGNYTFTTDTGIITLNLPANSAFILDATASIGTVTNDFSSNTVGDNPTSRLHVHTNTGSIAIYKL